MTYLKSDIVNVALNKPARMSSYYGQGSLRAAGAVDGNTNSTWPNVINTAENQSSAWWNVDLQREVQDATVRIYFRTDYKYRRNGVNLYTYSDPTRQGQLCYTVTGSHHGANIPNVVSTNCSGRWGYLQVYTNTDNDDKGALLDFGEVEVYDSYGLYCNKSCNYRHCVTSSVCDPQTGQYPDGCEPGWTGVDCKPCTSGSYGVNCSKSCSSRHCLRPSSMCDTKTGQCPDRCEPGWTGVDCTQECPAGTFGSDCTSCSTRHCQGESDCPADGTCSQGCKEGWTGNTCTQECSRGTSESSCPGNCSQCNAKCEPVPGQCSVECGRTRDKTECEVSGQSGHLLGGHLLVIVCSSAVGCGFILIVIISGVRYKRRKRRILRPGRTRQDVEAMAAVKGEQCVDAPREQIVCLPVHADPHPAPAPEGAELHVEAAVIVAKHGDVNHHCAYYNMEHLEENNEIALNDLESTVARIAKKNGFLKLFEHLPEGFLAPYGDSRLAVNAGKNKYKEYYPYDHNRVRLSLLPDVPGSDYINASIMHVYDNEKMYIATQAPNTKTVGDFWRMIWEQRVGHVVMLTGLVEGNIAKCLKYWPDEIFMDAEQYQIELTSTDQRANYTVRYLQTTSYESGESRRVVQYHYTTWPDHGVPDTLALVNFIWMMRRTHKRTDGPLLVHCSAGIGRTGTYIAVDSLLDQARVEGKVDVQGYVSIMRGQRKNMIQTVEQYECVFNCLVEMTKYGNTSLTVDVFTTLYTNSGMDAQVDSDSKTFRELAQMLVAEQRNDSPDQHRLWVDGNQDFLVTVLPSLRSVTGHLLCESPNPGQEKLLWKLVEENNVRDVIVLSHEQHVIDLSQGNRIKLGEITLTCLETSRMETELFFIRLKLEKNRLGHEIKLFRFDGHASIGSVTARILGNAPLRAVATRVDPVVIVHSRTDQHIAVSLTILLNVLSGVLTDRRVDITGLIRTSLQYCPRLQLSEHDIEQLHDVALRCVETLEDDRTYANM